MKAPFCSSIIGRKKELGKLEKIMQKMIAGQGSVALLQGRTGTGKKTLINTFLQKSLKSDADMILVARASCSKMIGYIEPFLPFSNLYTSIILDIEKIERKSALLKKVMGCSKELLQFIPAVGSSLSAVVSITEKLGSDSSSSRFKHLEKRKSDQLQLFSYYTGAFQAISEKYPMVLVIEELQWVDDSSMNLLSYLANHIREHSILVLGTINPEESVTRFGTNAYRELLTLSEANDNVTIISIGELKTPELKEYFDTALPGNEFPARFNEFVFNATKGNPLFVSELLRTFIESGEIVCEGEAWKLKKAVEEVTIPKHLEDLIQIRINRINDDHDLKMHEYASVQGDTFLSEILSECLQIDRIILSRHLRLVSNKYMLIEESPECEDRIGEYCFTHSIVSQKMYQNMSNEERVLLHRRIGKYLEDKYSNTAHMAENLAVIANHFEKALEEKKAFKYLVDAADYAQRSNSFKESLAMYEKAVKFSENKDVASSEEITRAMINIGSLYHILGQDNKASSILREALSWNEDVENEILRAENLTMLSIAMSCISENEKALSQLETARKIFEKNREDLSQSSLLAYGRCLNWIGIHHRNIQQMVKALEYHNAALELARQNGDRQLEAHAIANIGAVHLWQKDYAAVERFWLDALEISRTIEDLPMITHYSIDAGYIFMLNRKYSEALKYLDTGLKYAQDHGFEDNIVRGLMNKGSLLFITGKLNSALKQYSEATRIAERNDQKFLLWRLYHNIGNVHSKNGDDEEAFKQYAKAIDCIKDMASRIDLKDRKKFLKHRLSAFKSIMLICLKTRREKEAIRYAESSMHEEMKEYLARRKDRIDLDLEEKENRNYFNGYYVVTE
jgi:predicted ATPase